jgi:DNA repair protein RecO (recombination protein O)
MAEYYRTKAFVFKKSDTNEADRFYSVFTNDFGRLDIFAKAIRKNASKLKSSMDIFFLSDIEFVQGKNKKTLTDAIIIKKFNNIGENLEKFKIANKIGEVLDSFVKGEEKEEDLFNLLNEVFDKLNDSNLDVGKYSLMYYYFLWNVFSLLGYGSEVQKCACCHEKLIPYNIYFSSKEGGVICKGCFHKDKFAQKINSDIVKILRIILSKDWRTLLKLKIEPSSQKILSEISEVAIHTFCPAYC